MTGINLRPTAMLGLATVLLALAGFAGSAAVAKSKPSATMAPETTTTEATVSVAQATEKVQVCHRTRRRSRSTASR